MGRRLLRVALCCSLAASLIPGSAGADTSCVYPASYPGDSAPQSQIAAWMAGGAQAAGVPGEVPVMAGLAESGLRNLPATNSDSAGYFQMRKSIWEANYPSFESDPVQQLKWFTDQANKIRQAKTAAGDTTYGSDPLRYGEWAADIESPPEQQRGIYQPYLDQARSLIASGCGTATAPPVDNPPAQDVITVDTTPPLLMLSGRRTQDLAGTGALALTVTADEASTATLTATITLGGAARIYRLSSQPQQLAPWKGVALRVRLGGRLRTAMQAAIRRGRPPKISATVALTDTAGNRSVLTRAIRLPRAK